MGCYHDGQSLRRERAAAYLDMCPEIFDKIKHDIPSQPLYPGCDPRYKVWLVEDLAEYRRQCRDEAATVRRAPKMNDDGGWIYRL